MEPMVSFDANEIRNKKVDVLHAVRPIHHDEVHQCVVRGQYAKGWIGGKEVGGYREEDGVSAESETETFVAMRLFVDNWRWHDVPFYLRTGKRLRSKFSEVLIQFHPVPHQSFPSSAALAWQPNYLVLHIQPKEGIDMHFQAKQPGSNMRLSPVDMSFSYQDTFKARSPEAYETLLADVMQGDATLFMRADQVENSWAAIMPVLNAWDNTPPLNFPNYEAGTWGPEDAEMLIAQDGRSWIHPALFEDDQGKVTKAEEV
jgi:glucose-6-phosphate 1-dehydrogenase